jgi:hypothetical protein
MLGRLRQKIFASLAKISRRGKDAPGQRQAPAKKKGPVAGPLPLQLFQLAQAQ